MKVTTKIKLELDKTRKVIKLKKALNKIDILVITLINYYTVLTIDRGINQIKLNKINKILVKCNYKWLDINEKLSHLIKL